MTWSNVNSMTTASFAATIDVNDESIGSNTGTPIQLASITKPETGSDSWGGLDPHVSVAANSHYIAQIARQSLQTAYAGKEVDLDGIYLEETVV